jgi:hypothetical protein
MGSPPLPLVSPILLSHRALGHGLEIVDLQLPQGDTGIGAREFAGTPALQTGKEELCPLYQGSSS